MQVSFDSDKRKLLSCLCHAAIFFSTLFLSIGLPIVLKLISDDPVVKANANESINFHLNVWFWGTVVGVPIAFISFITFGIGGFLFFPVVAFGYLLHWGLTIWAIAHCLAQPDQPFRYPFIFRLV